MNAEEKIEIFRMHAGRYRSYQESVRLMDERIRFVQSKMENVHSPNLESTVSSGTYSEHPMVELIEQKTALEKKRQYYVDMIEWIEQLVDSVEAASLKVLIWMTYIQRRSLNSIAEEYQIRKELLYKARKKYLLLALTDEQMEMLNQIQEVTGE